MTLCACRNSLHRKNVDVDVHLARVTITMTCTLTLMVVGVARLTDADRTTEHDHTSRQDNARDLSPKMARERAVANQRDTSC